MNKSKKLSIKIKNVADINNIGIFETSMAFHSNEYILT
jgi:hypothetical protein